jgi:RHS repeat-associated protein
MLKLLRKCAEIVRRAKAVVSDLRSWRPEKENSRLCGHLRPTFRKERIAIALIAAGFAVLPTSKTDALPSISISGPGYQGGNIVQAFQIGNRRGRDPFLKLPRRAIQNANANGGNTNYLLTVPLLNLAGRGLSISLTMFYNSQMWTHQSTYTVFNHDHDWPAPGWSLGFGKIVQVGLHEGVLEDQDGTPHPYLAKGPVTYVGNPGNERFHWEAQTTDGSLIDYQVDSTAERLVSGSVQYPNGTVIAYEASGEYALYPTRITDANGNFVSIEYISYMLRWPAMPFGTEMFVTGPQIKTITDTLGRVINFEYDKLPAYWFGPPPKQLIAITAPSLNGTVRTVAHFHYNSTFTVKDNFAYEKWIIPPANPIQVLDGIYFPGTSTGYWFGDADSYSTYGMISKVSQRRGMTLTASSLNDQGSMTPGVMMHELLYNYPNADSPPLNDVPTYTTMTESWAGMDVPQAVTTYALGLNADGRTLDTCYPDGMHVCELRYNHPGQFDDGLLFRQTTYTSNPDSNSLGCGDGPGEKVFQRIETNWELGDRQSPVASSVKVRDSSGHSKITQYCYGFEVDVGENAPTNQLMRTVQYEYDQPLQGYNISKGVLRSTSYNYESDLAYFQRHIYNLLVAIAIDDDQGQLVSETDYAYDNQPLKDAPGVVGHDSAYSLDPNLPRGNVTQVTRSKSVSPNANITESRRYDITGNLIDLSAPCCLDTSYAYTVNTQYAYPEEITRGDPGNAAARVTRLFTYDFGTGLQTTSTDANQVTTTASYDPSSLRLKRVDLATGASTIYVYDDVDGVTEQGVFDAQKHIVSDVRSTFNGLGLVQNVSNQISLSDRNDVSRQYDQMGRLWKRSQPYLWTDKPVSWTVFSYDSLGRITAVQNPDGSKKVALYDEANRPSSASIDPKTGLPFPGQTVRAVDEMAREKWSRTDALGQLAEVVEPGANGTGSVFEAGNVDTSYSYNVLGLLTQVVQGKDRQERHFQYDPLGRLTAEYLPEKSRTLDGNGIYVGEQGQWSDVFTYDDRSNLISHVDARGVKTIYEFANDPLNRLQSVSYETPAAPYVDPSSPIATTSRADYEYMPTGDVTRLSSVTLLSGYPDQFAVEQEQYSYDPQGRLGSKTVSFLGKSPLVLTYKYDSLNRLRKEIYPIEYGTQAQAQKTLDYRYEIGGLPKDLKVDGADYASQFVYNPAGQATSITVGPSAGQQTVETYDYDPMTNLLKSQEVQRVGAVRRPLSLGYLYYPSGQLKQLTEIRQLPERSEILNYDYDALARLSDVKASENTLLPSTSPLWQETYAYDPYGNRLGVSTSGKGPDGSPIPLDGLAGSPTPANGLSALTYDRKTNRVKTPGFAYDAAGNEIGAPRLDGSAVRYRYDQAGRVTQVTDDSGKLLEQYFYGADGLRLQTLSPAGGTTFYFWNSDHVVAEYEQPSGSLNWAWSKGHVYLGDRILATFTPKESGEVVYCHHPDRLGTRLITNNDDNTATEQVTLPFGTVIPNGSSDPINPIFTSYDRSSHTGLDYAISRQYDSKERFTQADPAGISASTLSLPRSLNLYAYARNDPCNRVDPLGLDDTTVQCPDFLPSCAGQAPSGNGWGVGGAGGGGGGDSFQGVSGELWSWGCSGVNCGLYPSHILQAEGYQQVGLRTASAIMELGSYSGGELQAAYQFLSYTFSPAQVDTILRAATAAYASPSWDSGIGMIADARNWIAIFVGEDTASQLSWAHGGDFATGAALMSFTTVGLAGAVVGGVIADVFSTPARPFADIGCITCQAVQGIMGAYEAEYQLFIEPSFPWQVGEAAVESARQSFLDVLNSWQSGITTVYGGQ